MTDPPYLEHVHERMTSCAAQGGGRKGVRHRDAGFDHISEDLRAYVARAALASERWSLVYTDVQGNAGWELALGGYTKNNLKPRHIRTVPLTFEQEHWTGETDGGPIGTLPWIRWSMPQLSGDRPPSGAELLVCTHAPGKLSWRGPGNLTEIRHKCLRGVGKHPTEKPLDQALDLVSWFSDPGDLIYDPCAGGFTLGVACYLLGRSYLGCELDEEWWDHGTDRLEKAKQSVFVPKDAERIKRWKQSLGLTIEDLTIPEAAKRLVKGKIVEV